MRGKIPYSLLLTPYFVFSREVSMLEQEPMGQPGRIELFDADLQEPLHDEMLLWLDANIEPILKEAIYPGLTDEQIAAYSTHEGAIHKNWQQPIKTPAGEIVSFIDMLVRYERTGDPDDDIFKVFFFDVRTAIPSLGALVREINLHKNYLRFEQSWMYAYVLVCPDDRYAHLLEGQEIEFLHYQPEPEQLEPD